MSLVNYPIASLFQQVDVLLKGNLITNSTNTYAYRTMLEVLLGYDQGTKNSYLAMRLYCKDTATKMDLVAVDGANEGLKTRTQYIQETNLIKLSGLMHCDLVNLDRILLNSLPLKIVLHRQRDRLVLMADDASRDISVHIIEVQLCVWHFKLSDEK